MRIAIVHDWLISSAGAEKVLSEMLNFFPLADIFSCINFLPKNNKYELAAKKISTSFIQNAPFVKNNYRAYLPIMPLAIEQFDLSMYDLVISSSHAIAKGVLTGPEQLHICYCHTPMRYAWDLQHQYLQESGLVRGPKAWLVRWLLHKLRMWDARTANGVDHFITNSHFISRRIRKAYRRESTVIYPPVDVGNFELCLHKEDFYLVASRMVPYKKIPMIVEAFSRMPQRKLVVIGDGPDMAKCRLAAGRNIEVLGYQSDDVLKDYMQRAKAFVFAAEEDFGIAPVEAQACGTPVVAFGKGGALETIRGLDTDEPTGVFFGEQTPESLIAAIELFEKEGQNCITAEACRDNALRFSAERFQREFSSFVEARWAEFEAARISHQ